MAALLCSVALSRKRNPKCSAQAESSVTWSISLSVASRNPTHPKLNNSTLKIDVWKLYVFLLGPFATFQGRTTLNFRWVSLLFHRFLLVTSGNPNQVTSNPKELRGKFHHFGGFYVRYIETSWNQHEMNTLPGKDRWRSPVPLVLAPY